jgi:hypothetical protein
LIPVQPQGGISLKSSDKGKFAGFIALEFWVYVGVTGYEGTSATIPDVDVQIAGDQVRLVVREPLTRFHARCLLALSPPGQALAGYRGQL